MKSLLVASALALLCSLPSAAQELETFTLPAPEPGGGMWFDLQTRFPQVDWQTLDRLYIPAGHWCTLLLTGLPDRSPDRPLVITNIGGQVKLGGLGCSSHAILLRQGSNWRLTGKYDPVARTGHPDYPGHDGGYAHSAGTYGIWVDDAFETNGDSGVVVTAGATDFELDYLEVERNGFAGIVLKTDDDGVSHMRNVRVHDNYVHDNASEGVYLGSTQTPPQHKFPGLRFYNNRIVRSGTEGVQIGQIGRDSEIHNNVFVFSALTWRNPWGPWQDNGGQLGVREANVSIRNNILIGGAGTFFQLFPQPRDDDQHFPGDAIEIRDNYFSHSRHVGAFLHPQSDQVTELIVADNWFREMNFHYDELDGQTTDANVVMATWNSDMTMRFVDNTWTGPQTFITASTPNIITSGNTQASFAPVRFLDSGFPADFDYHRLEVWTATRPDGQAVTYGVGRYVTDIGQPGGGTIWRSLAVNSNQPPANNPAVWEEVPPPADDYRLHPDSPFQGIGLLDTGRSIFADGFESGDATLWSVARP
ncbi:MAG: right-handed parallel beta-helix repeat-containing protein [Acidobacteriota bacterium]